MHTAANGLVLALAAGAAPQGHAQGAAEPSLVAPGATAATPPDAPRTGKARFFDPEDGQLDLGDFLENPRGFLPIRTHSLHWIADPGFSDAIASKTRRSFSACTGTCSTRASTATASCTSCRRDARSNLPSEGTIFG